MRPVREDATGDELYEWFISALAGFGAAQETTPGVVRVHVRDGEEVWVCLTREELRSVAWAEVQVSDDTLPDVAPPTPTPVATGLDTFTFHAEESLASMRPGEHYLVFDGAQLRPSTRRELPPFRSPRFR